MLRDLKAALRELAKNRWFTAVTVLTLALGIGANTAIFGVVNRLMLNPLPYPGADELVFLGLNMRGLQGESVSFPAPNPVVAAWRDEARSVDGIESFNSTSVLAYDDNGGRLLRGARITPGLPRLLQVSPVLGRGFTPADVETGAPAVVILRSATQSARRRRLSRSTAVRRGSARSGPSARVTFLKRGRGQPEGGVDRSFVCV